MNSPCFKCPIRFEKCHTVCNAYEDYKSKIAEERKKQLEEQVVALYVIHATNKLDHAIKRNRRCKRWRKNER